MSKNTTNDFRGITPEQFQQFIVPLARLLLFQNIRIEGLLRNNPECTKIFSECQKTVLNELSGVNWLNSNFSEYFTPAQLNNSFSISQKICNEIIASDNPDHEEKDKDLAGDSDL